MACLLFECLTGTVPYGSRSDVAAIFAHLEEPVPSASERRTELPAAIDAVLARGMAKDPVDRYESCAALVEAAAEALDLRQPPRRSRSRLVPLLAGAVVLLAIAIGVVLLTAGGGDKTPTPTGALVRVDPTTNEAVARRGIRGHPSQLVVTPGGLWMADFRGGVLWRFEPGAGRLERVTSNGEPRDLAAFGDKVYVGADGRFLSGVVSRYDAVTGIREDGIDLLACVMASGEGVLWAAGCPAVQRLSTDTGRLRKLVEVFLPFQSPSTVENSRVQFREMAVGAGSLWVLGDALDRRLWRLDRRSGRVLATIELGFAPTSVAVANGTVWINRRRGGPARAARPRWQPASRRHQRGPRGERRGPGRRCRLGGEYARRHALARRSAGAADGGDDRRGRRPASGRGRRWLGLGDRA